MDNIKSGTLLSHPLVFVKDYDSVDRILASDNGVKEYLILADNVKRPSDSVSIRLGKDLTLIRFRPSGSWNTVIRFLGNVADEHEKGNYSEACDLMIISLIDATDMTAAFKRHRAVAQLSCREMYWLDTNHLGRESDLAVELALSDMPNVLAPVNYSDLSIEDRLCLTSFEFNRYMRPVHCVESVKNMQKAIPFYTDFRFGRTYQESGSETRFIRRKVAVK